MNAIGSVIQMQERDMLDSVWPEVLERQAELETPAWVEEWLDAAHQPQAVAERPEMADLWAEVAAGQEPIHTPNWQAEWLDWMDNTAAAKHSTPATPTPTVRPISAAKNLGASPRNTLPWLLSKQVEEELEIAA